MAGGRVLVSPTPRSGPAAPVLSTRAAPFIPPPRRPIGPPTLAATRPVRRSRLAGRSKWVGLKGARGSTKARPTSDAERSSASARGNLGPPKRASASEARSGPTEASGVDRRDPDGERGAKRAVSRPAWGFPWFAFRVSSNGWHTPSPDLPNRSVQKNKIPPQSDTYRLLGRCGVQDTKSEFSTADAFNSDQSTKSTVRNVYNSG